MARAQVAEATEGMCGHIPLTDEGHVNERKCGLTDPRNQRLRTLTAR